MAAFQAADLHPDFLNDSFPGTVEADRDVGVFPWDWFLTRHSVRRKDSPVLQGLRFNRRKIPESRPNLCSKSFRLES
ncbi:hypothetical protein PDE_04514 [Penicillium oxalicum 114-2]|uniref:Uncharacterized protein n=1 Tax=Penicillium oxalicum (strain 114-2 / CGMCC 5302) TaxID=933388 RepID=S7ZGZ8_PENO1|nr:hypothetical protein PDE_04514 [Penicillium oxalicum 114-2]